MALKRKKDLTDMRKWKQYFSKQTREGESMKKLLQGLLLVIVILGLFGCGSNVQSVANNYMVPFVGNVLPPETAEMELEKAFRKSTVPWDLESAKRIANARNAISGIGEYIKDRLNFDSSLSYYNYKVWFEFTSYQYMKLQVELDARVKVPGAINDIGLVLYQYVRRDINNKLEAERTKIAATEKSIESKASADTIEDMKNIYATLKPLISMGKGLIL